MIAFIALAALFAAAKFFATAFVFYPESLEGSGRLLSTLRGAAGEAGRRLGTFVMFGQEHPYVDMRETTIFVSISDIAALCALVDFVIVHDYSPHDS